MRSPSISRFSLSLACALLLTGCADWYAADADRQVYQLIRQTRRSLSDAPEEFTIDRPDVQPTILPELAARQDLNYNPESGSVSRMPSTRPTTRPATRPATQPAADGAIVLRLPDALRQAFLYSRDYQQQKEGLYLQALSLTLEYHLWTPQFVASFTAEMERTGQRPEVSRIFRHTGTLGVTQRLPYGGSVTSRILYSLVEDLREGVNELPAGSEDSKSGSLELSIDVPLLRGAGKVAQENLIQAKRELIYEVRTFERFRREFCVRIASRFFNLLLRARQVENRRMNWESLLALAKRSEALFKIDRVSKLDVQRAQQDAFSAENDHIDAKESYELALDEFKILLSLPTTAKIRLSREVPNIPEPVLSMKHGYALAKRRRLDLMNAHDRKDDAGRGVENAKNDLLADLKLTASASVPAGEFRNLSRYEFDEPQYRVGIELGLPVNRQSQRNAYRRVLIESERQRRAFEQFGDQVKLQVRTAIRRVRQASQGLKIQKQSIELAGKRLRFANLQLQEGKISNRDVVEAEESLLQAKNRYESALNSYRTAILEYMRDAGALRVGPEGMWQR